MFGVFAQAYVGNDYKVGVFFFNQAAGLLYRFFHVPGAAAGSVFVRRNAEQDNCRDFQFGNFVQHFRQAVERPVIVAGQGFDFVFNVFAGNDKKRID